MQILLIISRYDIGYEMELNTTSWMGLGTSLIFKRDGKPFKTKRSAERSAYFNDQSRVIDYCDGFALINGLEMTKKEAVHYLKHYVPYKAANQVYAEGVYESRRNPWPIELPQLCHKADEARRVLEMNYWQKPYEEARKQGGNQPIPYHTWEKARIRAGLEV
jgi:hypothetical protein